jgi:hypothetical protein
MPAIHELAILGKPSTDQVAAVEESVYAIAVKFDLHFGDEIKWLVTPADFEPDEQVAAAALFFGFPGSSLPPGISQRRKSVPILPIVQGGGSVSSLLPEELRPINALSFDDHGPDIIAAALLECVGLLPRQRAVFVSYRRSESRVAALQLFDALAARRFEVFLDTHGVPPGVEFQATLWHRLCDADVVVMLDTPTYFESRWTAEEFGRALAKGISVLRVGWPTVTPSPRAATATGIALAPSDIDLPTGTLSEAIIDKIGDEVERLRSQSIAVRRLNMISQLSYSIAKLGGSVKGLGVGGAVHMVLPNGTPFTALPVLGVPTSAVLQKASEVVPGVRAAVVFDHLGMHGDWLAHLDWLGSLIPEPRWLRSSDASWVLAGWSATP